MHIDRFSHLDDVVRITPSAEDVAVLTTTVEQLFDEIKDLDQPAAFDRMQVVGDELRSKVPELAELLQQIARHTSYKATVLSLPPPEADDLPPTPTAYRSTAENKLLKVGVYRGLVLGLAGWYGFGYTSQQPGNVINDVIAIKEMAGLTGASANAAAELGLHTEDASYDLGGAIKSDGTILDASFDTSPDWLTLQFLRNPDRVPTFVAAPDFTQLSEKTYDLLHQPLYVNLTNPGQGGAENDSGLPVSVLYDGVNGSGPWLRANTANLLVAKGAAPEAQAALDEFRNFLQGFAVDLPTDPGCIVLIDNRRVLHGRRDYTQAKAPKWDGTDRWQQRVVAADNAARIQAFEASARIVDPQYMLNKIGE